MEPKILEALIVHLKKGEVAIIPFDTCYGFICDGTSEPACRRLYQLKQRARSKPSSLIVPSLEVIEQYAILSDKQRAILDQITPGPVTVILRLRPEIDLPHGFVRTTYHTASFRIVKSDLISSILKRFKKPLLATSANLSGRPVVLCRTDLIMDSFQPERLSKVYKIMDETFERPSHSTVVDLTTDEPEIIRVGAMPSRLIKQAG